MSYDPAFTRRRVADDGAIHELDLVTLSAAVRTDEGVIVPEGVTGAVVAIWAKGEAFEIEFTGAFEGLVTVPADQIATHRRYDA